MAWNRIEWKVEPCFWVYFAIMLLVLPFPWVLGFTVAAAVHELGHLGMLRLCGKNILSVRICTFGVVISAEALSKREELLCAAAGPGCGLLLLLLARWFPVVGICALLQSVYNLLPVYPFDGARILDCLFGLFFPGKIGKSFSAVMEILTFSAMIASSIWALTVWKLGPVPLLISCWLLFLSAKKK